MSFSDLFKEFIPIRVDEDIYLRQHQPEMMPDRSGKYITKNPILHISGATKSPATGMRSARFVCSKAA